MGQRVRTLLWIATTPIALTFLLATPAGGSTQGHGAPAEAVGEHGEHAAAEATGHGEGHGAVVANPIENFADITYSGKDTHGGVYEPEKGDHPMPPPFLAALVNFGVFAFLLGKYGGPSIARYVRDRHETIARQLDEATRLRDEAKARLDEYTAKIAGLQGEIDKLVASIRKEADDEKQRILADAEARAVRLRKDAEMQIDAEIHRARTTLEREVVLAAVAAAEKILREKTSDTDHRALADRFVAALDVSTKPGAATSVTGGRVA